MGKVCLMFINFKKLSHCVQLFLKYIQYHYFNIDMLNVFKMQTSKTYIYWNLHFSKSCQQIFFLFTFFYFLLWSLSKKTCLIAGSFPRTWSWFWPGVYASRWHAYHPSSESTLGSWKWSSYETIIFWKGSS